MCIISLKIEFKSRIKCIRFPDKHSLTISKLITGDIYNFSASFKPSMGLIITSSQGISEIIDPMLK